MTFSLHIFKGPVKVRLVPADSEAAGPSDCLAGARDPRAPRRPVSFPAPPSFGTWIRRVASLDALDFYYTVGECRLQSADFLSVQRYRSHISRYFHDLRYNAVAGMSGMEPGQEVTDDRPANPRVAAASFK